jgi:CRISPR-associated protein Csm3
MQNIIKIKITTLSNLFIGGAPLPFEIGGIDQQTVLDREKFPYIPGSSLKGVLRTIAHEDNTTMGAEITRLYAAYLEAEQTANAQRIRELVREPEALERIEGKYTKAKEKLSPEYLFGIEGFNNTPKLLFSDLLLCEKYRGDKKSCFSIDMKNSIDAGGDTPISNPRTYRTARSGLVFEGDIRLYKMECWDDKAIEICKEYIVHTLLKFNEGIYRLGNSKSRGYGKVKAAII